MLVVVSGFVTCRYRTCMCHDFPYSCAVGRNRSVVVL